MASPLKRLDKPSKKTYYLAARAQDIVTRRARRIAKEQSKATGRDVRPNEREALEEIIYAVDKYGLPSAK